MSYVDSCEKCVYDKEEHEEHGGFTSDCIAEERQVAKNIAVRAPRSESFTFPNERLLEPRDVGKLVLIDHFGKLQGDKWSCDTYVGTLIGFRERRGIAGFGRGDDDSPADISHFPDYHLVVYLDSGRSFTIREGDTAHITIYSKEAA